MSKQLSDWVSQINKNVDINLRYTPGDVITSEQYNVLVSTQLLQDRLILNTNVGVNGSGGNENSANNSIVGEFDIEYVISKNGNFRVKAFNESNANSLINTNQAPYTQGVGLSYRQEFTRYRELISKKKKNKTNSK
ncbi:MAG: translocation/assembly module TamB domain-containing protein [Bacteroidetes bacterium]|nr:translocation/assembly module TamB domain-containing protein [Bacteroidota bacterium]